jgi:hypothetical protein
VFRITFDPEQALPLRAEGFRVREEVAVNAANSQAKMNYSRSQTRQGRAWTGKVQSAAASSLRHGARQQSVCGRDQSAASTGSNAPGATDANSPQTGNDPQLFRSAVAFPMKTSCEPERTKVCPSSRLIVATSPPTRFPVHVRSMSVDPAAVRKAVEEFTPRRPQKFQDLLPAENIITLLRQKRAASPVFAPIRLIPGAARCEPV